MGGSDSKEDLSHVSTVIQLLYNISDFRNYFLQKQYEENDKPNNNSKKYLSKLMNDIISKDPDDIKFNKCVEKITECLKDNYKLDIAETPGQNLILILMILKYEEKLINTESWEKHVNKVPQLFNNCINEKMALNDILEQNRDHFNTSFCGMFFGIFLTRRKYMDSNNILFFYDFYCTYELNMPLIYQNMINEGKIFINNNNINQLPQLNLIDCIMEMMQTHTGKYNGKDCFVEYNMFNAPNYLIFLLKSSEPNFEDFRGNIFFPENFNFSQVIQNTQPNMFRLFGVINQGRYQSKAVYEKGEKWSQNEEDCDNKKFKAIFRDEKINQYCYYNKDDEKKNCQLQINDTEYYHHVIIYKRC